MIEVTCPVCDGVGTNCLYCDGRGQLVEDHYGQWAPGTKHSYNHEVAECLEAEYEGWALEG